MTTTTKTEQYRAEALQLLDERDMRFFDGNDVYNGPVRTAGEMLRLAQRAPLLDHEGAAVLVDATRTYAIPAMSDQELCHFIFCAKRCPKKGVRS